jgi:hypothetical protein
MNNELDILQAVSDNSMTPEEGLKALQVLQGQDSRVLGWAWEVQGISGRQFTASKSIADAVQSEGHKVTPLTPYTTVPMVTVPEGYALVPEFITLEYDDIEAIVTMTGWDGDADEFGDGVLWVGTLKDDDGKQTYGLHISCSECMEEGGLPVQEFSKPELVATPDAIPEGWNIYEESEGTIVFDVEGLGFYVARSNAERIADIMLYALGQELLRPGEASQSRESQTQAHAQTPDSNIIPEVAE